MGFGLGAMGNVRRGGFGSGGALGTAGTSGPPPANTLQAGTGSFLVTGVGMSPVVQSLMASDSGSFALTGNSATLTKVSSGATAYTLTSAQGTFVLTGQAATLSYQGFFRQFDMVGGTYINKPTNRQWQVGETYAAGA